MGRRKLLFVTYDDVRLEEGFAYAVNLAKLLGKDLLLLLVKEKKLSEKFEDVMTAVTFAEANEVNTAKELLEKGCKEVDKSFNRKFAHLLNRCRMAGVEAAAHTTEQSLFKGVNGLIKQEPGIEMVLLGPTVTGAGSLSPKELKKLVSRVSRPVVTMVRQAL